jgi:hypothetical protein
VQTPFTIKDLRGDNVTNVGWAILLPKPSFAKAPQADRCRPREGGDP